VGFLAGFGDDMFRFGGVKYFVDGIGNDFMGNAVADVKWDVPLLRDALTQCNRGGLQAIMHVVTAEGMALALDALEGAMQAAPSRMRHRIDHRTPTDDATIERARRLGIIFGVTAPRFRPGAQSGRGGGAYGRQHRYRTLAEKDMLIAVLDAAGPGGFYHPMQGIANMVTDHDAGGAAPPGETLTLEQALRSWTLWPAQSNFEGHAKGSIEVGKFGDFAVLSADPFGKSPQDIHAIQTPATILGGNVVNGS